MDIFALTWQVMLGWRDSQSCSWRQQTVYRCSWQWGMDAHLCILYGLYLIFLRGGRLNQQRPSSGQSASRRRVLHPPPPPLSHSSHCCISFCILCHFQSNAWMHECRTCARWKNDHILYSERNQGENINYSVCLGAMFQNQGAAASLGILLYLFTFCSLYAYNILSATTPSLRANVGHLKLNTLEASSRGTCLFLDAQRSEPHCISQGAGAGLFQVQKKKSIDIN